MNWLKKEVILLLYRSQNLKKWSKKRKKMKMPLKNRKKWKINLNPRQKSYLKLSLIFHFQPQTILSCLSYRHLWSTKFYFWASHLLLFPLFCSEFTGIFTSGVKNICMWQMKNRKWTWKSLYKKQKWHILTLSVWLIYLSEG